MVGDNTPIEDSGTECHREGEFDMVTGCIGRRRRGGWRRVVGGG